MGAGRKTETFYAATPSTPTQTRTNAWHGTYSVAARNLREDELGGVIFGCKHNTMNECLTKQLFGLPSGHISYVKNVKPGMPLFLFNYSDRKMHGIFEAACAGKLNIDQFAWSDGGRIKTQFPAQVLVSTKIQCYPVHESQFKSVISDNYHKPRHFYFELDHEQTSALISLFKPAPVHDVATEWDPSKFLQSPTTKPYLNPGPTKSEFYTKDLDPSGVSSESHYAAPYKLADLEGEYASASRTSTSHLDEESSNWDDLDDVGVATKEGTESVINDHQHNPPHEAQHDTVAVRQKLQELFVSRQQESQFSNDTVDSASYKSMPQESQFGSALPTDPPDSISKADAPIEDLTSLGKCHGNAELLHIINELSKRTRAMEKKLVESDKEKLSLRESVKDTERRVQQLEYHFEKLQLNYNSLVPLLGRPYDNIEGTSVFILGGYRGSTCLSSLDAFCPRTDRLVLLCPMSSARAYAAAAALNNNIYIFGGGDGSSWYHSVEYYSRGENRWITCPRLRHKKGSLAGTTLNDKIFAIGGGDGSVAFSEVEMFDPALGRWIDSLSMRQNRFAPAAAVHNNSLYVTGGYDGNMYLQSAERYDPREGFWSLLPSMSVRRGSHSVAVLGEALYAVGGYDGSNNISTMDIFDSRANSWRIGSPFSVARGYGCAVTVDDNLFYIGGVNDAGETVDTVEVYNERQGWSISGCQSVGGRGFACAIAA